MDPKEYEIMDKVQDTHWWYGGMAAITRTLIESFCNRGANLRILDAGCGTGACTALLSDYGSVTSLDLSPFALRLCRKRGRQPLVCASVTKVPFSDRTFDLVVSLDVLYFEHLHDTAALSEYERVLVPGGRVMLRVPAYNWLRGIHDKKVSTGHRYTLGEISDKLKESGLEPQVMSYANMVLFPLILLKRMSEKWVAIQSDSDLALDVGPLRRLFRLCLIFESHMIKKWPLPFGASVVGIAQKPLYELR